MKALHTIFCTSILTIVAAPQFSLASTIALASIKNIDIKLLDLDKNDGITPSWIRTGIGVYSHSEISASQTGVDFRAASVNQTNAGYSVRTIAEADAIGYASGRSSQNGSMAIGNITYPATFYAAQYGTEYFQLSPHTEVVISGILHGSVWTNRPPSPLNAAWATSTVGLTMDYAPTMSENGFASTVSPGVGLQFDKSFSLHIANLGATPLRASYSFNTTVAGTEVGPIPEPETYLMLFTGLLCLAGIKKWKNREIEYIQ